MEKHPYDGDTGKPEEDLALKFLGSEDLSMHQEGDPTELMREVVKEIVRKKYVLKGLELATKESIPVYTRVLSDTQVYDAEQMIKWQEGNEVGECVVTILIPFLC